MKTIKRTSPGPTIGPSGTPKGAPKNVGTKGNTTGNSSTDGGQYPFMPPASSYSGSREGSDKADKPGQVANSDKENLYDFLPKKAGQKQ